MAAIARAQGAEGIGPVRTPKELAKAEIPLEQCPSVSTLAPAAQDPQEWKAPKSRFRSSD